MPVHDLKERIARLPEQPGVYLWMGAGEDTLYVGKARSLRSRVRSYLGARGTSPRIDALLEDIVDIQVIVTDSVVEALALENHLIKQRAPKYNVLLRDDKSYPYLQLTTSEAFPRVLVARHVEPGGDYFAGPFLPARLARRTMGLAHRLFGLRSCNEVITGRRERPCLEYDIKRCAAPCVAEICSAERYGEAVRQTRLLLDGRTDELAETLRARMGEAAEAERFEEAAHLRDAMRTVENLRDRQQKVATVGQGDRDVFGLKAGPSGAVVLVFQMRGGRVLERVELAASPAGGAEGADVLESVVQQFYGEREPPPEVHLPRTLEESQALEAWLSARASRRVRLRVPKRGDRRALVDLATRNAELSYRTRFNDITAAHFEALETLRSVLALPGVPRRIECFDISTIQGSETVASMVVCEDGRMRRGEYRKYRIKGGEGSRLTAQGLGLEARESRARPDDFAAMREVVQRRYRTLLELGGPFPDLVLIDGGRGQVSAAYDALESIGLGNLVAAGLAKREDVLFIRERAAPIVLPTGHPALLLLQRIRDEAHRFAVTYHRRARAMRDLRSELDRVPGIGSRRRQALLRAFGSVAGVRRATLEELTAVVGPRAAGSVIGFFARSA
ncbi:MAG: excinuclease ABC subunit UvrC [Acidimicrobiia bacterium]|nr:excinuclease ABC subunit UvrC [Acidimicrobiia bacterium]